MGNTDISFYNQIFCLAKALNEHAIILNLDDAQMGRLTPKLIESGTIPVARMYPIQVPEKMKEDMVELGFKDFWEYFFNANKVRQQRKKEEEKSKKKRWPF